MNRREFLKKTAVSAAATSLLAWPNEVWAGGTVNLTILHTNDMHSRIDPFPNDGRTNGGLGGMARRATLINQIRQQEKNVLLLDSGDIFQGTPYFNFFGGELEYKLMTQMRYDATTFGNHDFDNGLAGLQRQLPNAGFSFLSANYDFSNTILKNQFQPYQVFEKEGIKIGVFGLGIELAGLVDKKNYGATVYLDPGQRAADMVKQLREKENCNLVICLSHLGYKYENAKIDDRKLAQQVPGIDLILGGHTHTFMEAPEKINRTNGHETLINQVGWAGINLGRMDFTFSKKSKQKINVAAAVLPIGKTVISS
ncbi:bifunctional metallophosphatase/5'-nucleotidase [Adhaeribacter pallidiroseus]|uniref:5'-nucleotidase n=1 Tax=Adhaeribacter pallidiroseus TaxID=2072847 RepID=A0A369QUT3_9BACT|nr:metallophosphatase [Adhaeribacter pallidiroseus]RDC66549.1 5'-nucleotidase [Adhaeribacter pallidiroseus]